MLRYETKILCGFILFVTMPICFLLPVKMADVVTKYGARGQLCLDLLTCFAGGVFLSSYLVFMAPAVRVLIETNVMKPNGIVYPLPDMLIGLGFFVMLALDKLVHFVNARTRLKSDVPRESSADRFQNGDDRFQNGGDRFKKGGDQFQNGGDRFQNGDDRFQNGDDRFQNGGDRFQNGGDQFQNGGDRFQNGDDRFQNGVDRIQNGGDRFQNGGDRFQNGSDRFQNGDDRFQNGDNRFQNGDNRFQNGVDRLQNGGDRLQNGGERSEHNSGMATADGVANQFSMSMTSIRPTGSVSQCSAEVPSRNKAIVDLASSSQEANLRSVVMMMALSIDSVLEGMTIGLKETVVEVWAIFIGIIVHESVIAFCLGLQMVRLNPRSLYPVIASCVVYTLMNPIGVLIATAVYETMANDPGVEIANGVLQALTSGCFIYVIFYEILEGQITQNTPASKILAIFVGYAFLSAFAAIPEGSHSAENSDCGHCFANLSISNS